MIKTMTPPTDNPPDTAGRPRQRPDERFAPPARSFDLSAAAAELATDPTATSSHGHRQKMLYRHGGTSISLFLFDAGAGLKQHRTNGTVIIQALAGRLTIHADDARHDLPAGNVLVMSPGVVHDVYAQHEPARMLLTISLNSA
jgi:quercetin dioxygenase-like cupin family protein